MLGRLVLLCGGAVALSLPASADPVVMYESDFESGPLGTRWSSNALLVSTPANQFTRFLGRHGNETVTLTLTAAPPPPDTGGGVPVGSPLPPTSPGGPTSPPPPPPPP
ncbi:MAG: hypothetical protein KDA05_03945, partial [Phycisphaerales bacterium]|nr:hypothetical protein [Phycisphaerales bacterium]